MLEADDQRKRLQIGNATTYSRWIRKEATSAIPSHAEKQPHGSRKSTLNCFTACQPQNNTFLGNEQLRRSLLTAVKIHCSHVFEMFYRVFCLFIFLRFFWQESTIFLANRVL